MTIEISTANNKYKMQQVKKCYPNHLLCQQANICIILSRHTNLPTTVKFIYECVDPSLVYK